MIEVKGTYNTAKLFTDTADDATIAQVTNLMNQPSVEGAKVRIMPDCHAGSGCVIGTTMTINPIMTIAKKVEQKITHLVVHGELIMMDFDTKLRTSKT